MISFREFLLEKSYNYKTKEQSGYPFKATLSSIDKITNQRKLEVLFFKTELDAVGYAESTKKELEAVKNLNK